MPRQTGTWIIVLTCIACWALLPGAMLQVPLRADEVPRAVTGRIVRATDNGGKHVVRLPSHGGRVPKANVLAELGLVAGIDLRAIEWLLPDGEFNLDDPKTKRRLSRMNVFLGRYAKAKIARDTATDEPELVISVDRPRIETDKRRVQSTVRTVSLTAVDPRGTLRAKSEYGLHIDDAAQKQTTGQLVVGIHGFNAKPFAMDAFLNPLREAGHACASFVYPNDQPIADSAKLLARELKSLARREPKRRVVVVAFSMGGLVARAAIEDAALHPGNVDRLIMIAPPNQGTVCARYARGSDLYEHLYRDRQLEPRRLLVASMFDGMGEARHDLCPESQFLRLLNSGKRNEQVRYSILLGEGCELPSEIKDRALASMERLEEKSNLVRLFGPKLDRVRADLDEMAEPGDGIISVRRGRLGDVDDVEILEFSHADRFADLDNERVRLLHAEIAQRLK